jgi:hypothetical protein
LPPLNKFWDDESVYEYFDMHEEFIDEIEEFAKQRKPKKKLSENSFLLILKLKKIEK